MPIPPELQAAADLVHSVMPPTPQICWPLLSERAGAEVWVKHENHTPIGAFKIRGGLTYMAELKRRQPAVPGVITATRGNHGQSVGFAARRAGLPAVVVVPHGNSTEKNRAMRALGVELIEHGHDFQAAYEHAMATLPVRTTASCTRTRSTGSRIRPSSASSTTSSRISSTRRRR